MKCVTVRVLYLFWRGVTIQRKIYVDCWIDCIDGLFKKNINNIFKEDWLVANGYKYKIFLEAII